MTRSGLHGLFGGQPEAKGDIMDNNKDPGSNVALWLPGSAIIISLVVSTFALTRPPLIEIRPAGVPGQAELPIEARLWQDPFDALERYRKKVNTGKKDVESPCRDEVSSDQDLNGPTETPSLMVALVEGGPYADEVELRRRTRYAILAGFKNAHMVPADEQHVRCLTIKNENLSYQNPTKEIEIPYETFIANPFDPPKDADGKHKPHARTILFWIKQDYLGQSPLSSLASLHNILSKKLNSQNGDLIATNFQPDNGVLKVIGPSDSKVLRDIYREDFDYRYSGNPAPSVEIYSPLATADKEMLTYGFDEQSTSIVGIAQKNLAGSAHKEKIRLLRTISDDGTLTRLLLDELKRRAIDPVYAVQCRNGAPVRRGVSCDRSGRQLRSNRVALISEWDSFYTRALTESFKSVVAERAGIAAQERAVIDNWVLRFSYLRGLDGRLPEETADGGKAASQGSSKDSNQLDASPPERSDGNSQLDYLRRLADHIALQDEAYRRAGEPGIGAIGVLGTDAYDKLLVLQALKNRMPNKLFFSTDLDARMLQKGQAQTARNLVLASPYGLTLTSALQQDVPPFRDSLQSAVFVAVLAAQAPQTFEAKRQRFDYSTSGLLSPGIYEVGISGFIPLASSPVDVCEAFAAVQARAGDDTNAGARKEIMRLYCLQDQPLSPYPEPTDAQRKTLDRFMSTWLAGPLSLILLVLAIFFGWWWTANPATANKTLPAWVRNLPLTLYLGAALSAWATTWNWRVEFMWATFLLLLLGIICSQLNRHLHQHATREAGAADMTSRRVFDSTAYYILLPMVVFILVVLWAYQKRQILTENGLGEPMLLFEGISAWPTMALRLLAVLISISALAWGWRCLRINRDEIELSHRLTTVDPSLWTQFPRFTDPTGRRPFNQWLNELGHYLFKIIFPLSSTSMAWVKAHEVSDRSGEMDGRPVIDFDRFWTEHCVCGSFGARMLRAGLATWIFVVATSVLYVLWPFEGAPIRGEWPMLKLGWIVPTLAFQLLVFWVVDANRLLVRFIRQLSDHHAIWPSSLQKEHERIFGKLKHPCIDEWVDLTLIAKRSSAVNRLIYAPTVVLLILIASRSSVFDNWPTPPGLVINYALTALILLLSALSLRRAAEKARVAALQRLDAHLLETPSGESGYDKFRMIRERIAALSTGAFSRYAEEPLVRALLLSLTGLGGSAIVDALNFAKF